MYKKIDGVHAKNKRERDTGNAEMEKLIPVKW